MKLNVSRSEKKSNSKIRIIGTSHISEQSVDEIKKTVAEFKPDIVAVELDSQRYAALMSRRRRKLKLRSALKLGFFGFLFYIVGSISQKILGKKTGQQPGIDMKTGILEAKKSGAKVALIDRDISETLYRLSKKVPAREKSKLVFYLLFGGFSKNKINLDLSKVPKDKLVHKLISELSHKFPGFYRVLVAERDTYMQNQVQLIAHKFPDSKLLIIIGAGHKEKMKKFVSKLINTNQ
ncbi:MAG: TraB family protein [Candidatus Nanoarchaeia archaeon]|jgi:pheromone shutdown-related protein TraB|nr:TraB family protein [Candidatus Nanoarchaeia archaeon]